MHTPSRSLKNACVLAGLALLTCGQLGAQTTTEAMLEALVRPQGWRADWTGPGGSGITEIRFEKVGAGVVAKIHLITPVDMTCENPVTIAADRVTFDGCRDRSVALIYDAANPATPFQGKSPLGYEWKLRPK